MDIVLSPGVTWTYNSNEAGGPVVFERKRSHPCATNSANGHGSRALQNSRERSARPPKRKRSSRVSPRRRRHRLCLEHRSRNARPFPCDVSENTGEKRPRARGAFLLLEGARYSDFARTLGS